MKTAPKKQTLPPQTQDQQPGIESEMTPHPKSEEPSIAGSGRLQGKVAVISGGDSGIGKAVALAMAKEGADVAILYLNEHDDAKTTQKEVEHRHHRKCLTIACDIGQEDECKKAIQ